MFSINTLNSGTDNEQLNNRQFNKVIEKTWLKLSKVNDLNELSSQYADICEQHKEEKKWVLIINPEDASLEQLARKHGVDTSKVLCVSFKGKNKINNMLDDKSAHLDIEQIKGVLSRGNCSAVILSNATFNQDEIQVLSRSAQLGETQCVLLNSGKSQLH